MAQLTVKDLKRSLENAPDDALIVFQGNESGEDDEENDEPGYTTTIGYAYSAFLRSPKELVIDCAITSQE